MSHSPADPDDLDFTAMLAPQGAEVAPAPRTPEVEEAGLLGEDALGREGLYLVFNRRPPTSSERRYALIVEDHDDTAALAEHALQRGGWRTASARDAKQAGALLAELGPPAIFLLDVELPGIDGFRMLAKLRAHSQLAHIPIVMVTARGEREDVVRGLRLGADGYVVKPVAPATLLDAVHKVVGS